MAFRPVEPSKSPVQNVQEGSELLTGEKPTVDDQDLLGSLLLGQGIENGIYGLTKDGTICGNLLRGTKVLITERVGFDAVQDVASNVGFPAALLKVFQSRLDGNNIVGMATAFHVRKSLSENRRCK